MKLSTELKQFNDLINPTNKPIYYATENKWGPSIHIEPALTLTEAFNKLSADYPNLKVRLEETEVYFIDCDDPEEFISIRQDLENRGVKYIAYYTSGNQGHLYVKKDRNKLRPLNYHIKGYNHCIIFDYFKLRGPMNVSSHGPLIPTPFNEREFETIPDELGTIPLDF